MLLAAALAYVAVRRYGLHDGLDYELAALHPAQARTAPAHGARPGEMS
ncbi:MAG TPA: hypothetical protein VJP60_05590 [Rhizomicrobium sp.]|nr:hypothetical protein [Rhizomicrobium sp.]